MTTPVRIQRKRTRGFDLQAASRAVNGLECVYVGRPSKWGNPFSLRDIADAFDCGAFTAHMIAMHTFQDWLAATDEHFALMRSFDGTKQERDAILAEIDNLRGKNLACFCALGSPCHADVLLGLANRPIKCEAAE